MRSRDPSRSCRTIKNEQGRGTRALGRRTWRGGAVEEWSGRLRRRGRTGGGSMTTVHRLPGRPARLRRHQFFSPLQFFIFWKTPLLFTLSELCHYNPTSPTSMPCSRSGAYLDPLVVTYSRISMMPLLSSQMCRRLRSPLSLSRWILAGGEGNETARHGKEQDSEPHQGMVLSASREAGQRLPMFVTPQHRV